MIPVVEGAAADVASLIASPIPLKSADALANASGAMFRKDDISGSNHLRTSTTTTIIKTALRTVRPPDPVRSQFREFYSAFPPPHRSDHPGVYLISGESAEMGRRNGPPTRIRATRIDPQARMATGLPSGVSPARTLAVAQPPTTTPMTHPHRSTPPPASTPPAQTSPADQHRAQTPTTHHPDTPNLPSTTHAAPTNNAPALKDTDIARAAAIPRRL
jgi:hypothetical protein